MVALVSSTEGTKSWFTYIRTLRVLRDLRGERNQGNSARLPTQKPEELQILAKLNHYRQLD